MRRSGRAHGIEQPRPTSVSLFSERSLARKRRARSIPAARPDCIFSWRVHMSNGRHGREMFFIDGVSGPWIQTVIPSIGPPRRMNSRRVQVRPAGSRSAGDSQFAGTPVRALCGDESS